MEWELRYEPESGYSGTGTGALEDAEDGAVVTLVASDIPGAELVEPLDNGSLEMVATMQRN